MVSKRFALKLKKTVFGNITTSKLHRKLSLSRQVSKFI